MNLQNKKRLTALENELTVASGGRMKGRDNWGVWDGHVHTAIFKRDNQQGLTAYHTCVPATNFLKFLFC